MERYGAARMGKAGDVRHGRAKRGEAGLGKARSVGARQAWHVIASCGQVGYVPERKGAAGIARRGMAVHGLLMRGMDRQVRENDWR